MMSVSAVQKSFPSLSSTYAALSLTFALVIDFDMQAGGEKEEKEIHCIWYMQAHAI